MGILDNLRQKVEQLGDKAREGLDVARDKAGDLAEDVRERLGHDEDDAGDRAPTGESEDVGPDSSSTDAVQPGYVTGEDADGDGTDEGGGSETDDESYAESGSDAYAEPDAGSDELVPDAEAADEGAGTDAGDDTDDAAALEPAEPAEVPSDGASGTETDAPDDADAPSADGVDLGGPGEDEPLEPVVTDVDPSEQPLSESIGSELSEADRAALAGAVDDTADRDS